MPTECPAQSVAVHVTRKIATASHDTVNAPPMIPAPAMPKVQSERVGVQTTLPSSGEHPGVATMRSVEIQSIGFPLDLPATEGHF